MNRTEHNPEALLDAAIEGVRNEPVDARVVEEAGQRAWARILAAAAASEAAPSAAPDHIASCEDFQALLPKYREGELPPGRRMLVEDHLHECVKCRKALHPVTVRMTPAAVTEMPKRRVRVMPWAIAAAATAVVTSLSFYAYEMLSPAPGSTRMSVVAATGQVYKLHQGALEPLAQGAQLGEGERIRTAGDGHAMVRLHDGSAVEISERAELFVTASRRDTTVHIDRGSIIVQAAKRDRGHLYVISPDSRVAVTGTIFAVTRGLKGSRVSVVEGSVEVRHRGDQHNRLGPGDQVTTDSAMARVPITEEISWSRNFDQHLSVLNQFADFRKKLEEVRISGLRYGSRLLDAIPEGTTVYVAVPNLGRAVADIERIVREQSAQSPELRQWLDRQFPDFEKAAKQIQTLNEFLGEEIAVAFQPCKGFCGVFIAEVHRPGLREFIEKQAPADSELRVVEPSAISAAASGMLVVFSGNRVFMGQNHDLLRAAIAGNSRFTQSPFGQTVSGIYSRGVGLLVAADLETMVRKQAAGDAETGGMFAALGIDRARHLIAEQREIGGRTNYSAVLTFEGPRRGVTSWVAQPGAMGSLSFVSRDAQFATSWVVKEPAQMLKDAIGFSQNVSRSNMTVDEFERTTGVDLEDMAGAMGGEVTFALDGPMIPTPAWKMIFEVKDAARVQAAIEKMVASANEKLRQHGDVSVELSSSESAQHEQSGPAGRQGTSSVVYSVRLPRNPIGEAHYSFVDGYLVIASSEAFLARAISDRRSGVTLARSREFRRLLPRDERAYLSGMVYQNAGELIRLMAKGAADVAGDSPERQQQIEQLTQKIEPMLVAVYGEPDRVEIASQGSALDLLTQGLTGNLMSQFSGGTRERQRSYR